MSDLDLDELERVARAATPGPWRHRSREDEAGERESYVQASEAGLNRVLVGWTEAEDAEHIATFDPPTALRLIEAVRLARSCRGPLAHHGRVLGGGVVNSADGIWIGGEYLTQVGSHAKVVRVVSARMDDFGTWRFYCVDEDGKTLSPRTAGKLVELPKRKDPKP